MALFNICAGHGANDSGAVGPGRRQEKDDNLSMALKVGEELTNRGHTVRLLRTDDSINNTWRICRDWLEKNPADFSLVFHRNAYNGKVGGVEVWSFDSDSLSSKIAVEMSGALAGAGDFSNRGRKGNGAAWLSEKVRCCQLEIGFIDCESDNQKFDLHFESIKNAVCDTMCKFFEATNNNELQKLQDEVRKQKETISIMQNKINAIKTILES